MVGYRSGAEEAEAVAKEAGGRAVQADVSDPEQAKRLVEEAGDLDILVNNAGLTRDGLLARMSDEDWRDVIETNLSSVFYTCRAVTRGMMKKRAGSIVNVSASSASTATGARRTTAPRRPGSSASPSRWPASSAAAACARTWSRRAM